MGIYDKYGDVQLKVGECQLTQYNIGDETDIPDGIYVGYEGCVVIKKGKFIAQYKTMHNKWGGVIECNEVISNDNPVKKAIDEISKRREDAERKD